jgi:branched-chain amino acid transport system permease protein
MIYRETGQIKTNYAADQQMFPIAQDRWIIFSFIAALFIIPPLFASEYQYEVILYPILSLGLAALGLNILTGYCGLISLGTGGFMAIGAYSAFKITTIFPDLNIFIVFILAGLITALFGVLIGLPSLRIKGFYLAVTTLAAHFFIEWSINRIDWLSDYSPSHTIGGPPRQMFGIEVMGPNAAPAAKYIIMLTVVVVLGFAAKNLVRGRVGRSWMAIRDMDIAAELIGIRPLTTKLLAFAVSSFYIGVAGALYVLMYLESVDPEAFEILTTSFPVLFMIIIGGLGSIMGSFMGATFIVMIPVFLRNVFPTLGIEIPSHVIQHVEFMLFGGLIVFFLIVEPNGLARLWQIAKEKLRLWPFPH